MISLSITVPAPRPVALPCTHLKWHTIVHGVTINVHLQIISRMATCGHSEPGGWRIHLPPNFTWASTQWGSGGTTVIHQRCITWDGLPSACLTIDATLSPSRDPAVRAQDSALSLNNSSEWQNPLATSIFSWSSYILPSKIQSEPPFIKRLGYSMWSWTFQFCAYITDAIFMMYGSPVLRHPLLLSHLLHSAPVGVIKKV